MGICAVAMDCRLSHQYATEKSVTRNFGLIILITQINTLKNKMKPKYTTAKPEELTQELKISLLDCALQLQGIQTSRKLLDQIITTYELVLEKQANFSLGEGLTIADDIRKKYDKKSKNNEQK